MNPCLNKNSIETDVQPVPATLTPKAALPNISHSSCDNSLPNSRIHSSHVQVSTVFFLIPNCLVHGENMFLSSAL